MTVSVVRLVKDLRPGPGGSGVSKITAAGTRIYFIADDGEHGPEPWVSDGTSEGTLLVADLRPGGLGFFTYGGGVALLGDTLYLTGDDGLHGGEPWALPRPGTFDPRVGAAFTLAEEPGGTFRLDGSPSQGADGGPLASFRWSLGGGLEAEGMQTEGVFTPGRHRISLLVEDTGGRTGLARELLSVPCPLGAVDPFTAVDIGRMYFGFPASSRIETEGAASRLEVCAGGRRIGGMRDGFHFVHKSAAQDIELSARVDEISGTAGAQAGLMVREDLDATARFVAVLYRIGTDGESFHPEVLQRGEAGGEAESVFEAPVDGLAPPRLIRRGDEIIAFAGPDGAPRGNPLVRTNLPGLAAEVLAGVAAQGAELTPEEEFLALNATFSNLLLSDAPPVLFVRGDANGDGSKDISDAVTILGLLFLGTPSQIPCRKSGDIDDSGALDITDPVALLNNLFLGGTRPAPPNPECGDDSSEDGVTCRSFPPCDGEPAEG